METLTLHNLSKSFGGLKAVDSVTLEFAKGRIIALVGPNGAGKTTLFNLISGLLKPEQGDVYYEGKRIDGLPPWEIARLGIGRLFQDVRVFNKLSVLENVLLGRLFHPGEFPYNVLFSHKNVTKVERGNLEEARHWIDVVGLAGEEDSLAEALSFGQQKLLTFARLLAGHHKLLLLDEPTAGVNPVMIKFLLDLIKKIVEGGRTVVFIEHNMTVVFDIADWVYFLDDGRIVSFGLPADVLGDTEIRKAYLGI
jgi:ABC-type branched-subunit amino acid transport system ATPase component